jgi:hypothetical protein
MEQDIGTIMAIQFVCVSITKAFIAFIISLEIALG